MPLARPPVVSQIGGRRATQVDNGFRSGVYTEAMWPAVEPAAHLQFHLRHEVPHLEFLARLFERSGTRIRNLQTFSIANMAKRR